MLTHRPPPTSPAQHSPPSFPAHVLRISYFRFADEYYLRSDDDARIFGELLISIAAARQYRRAFYALCCARFSLAARRWAKQAALAFGAAMCIKGSAAAAQRARGAKRACGLVYGSMRSSGSVFCSVCFQWRVRQN
jgi:hypothetical protein